MIFKDINSGFYVLKRPMQYACTHDEVAQMAQRNGIVKRPFIISIRVRMPIRLRWTMPGPPAVRSILWCG